jgi:hypothetical protein
MEVHNHVEFPSPDLAHQHYHLVDRMQHGPIPQSYAIHGDYVVDGRT